MLVRQLQRYAPDRGARSAPAGERLVRRHAATSRARSSTRSRPVTRKWRRRTLERALARPLQRTARRRRCCAGSTRCPTRPSRLPELALARCGVARAMGRLEEAEPWLDLAEGAAERVARRGAGRAPRQRGPPARDGIAVAHADAARPCAGPARGRHPSGGVARARVARYFLAIASSSPASRARRRRCCAATWTRLPPGEQDVRRCSRWRSLARPTRSAASSRRPRR